MRSRPTVRSPTREPSANRSTSRWIELRGALRRRDRSMRLNSCSDAAAGEGGSPPASGSERMEVATRRRRTIRSTDQRLTARCVGTSAAPFQRWTDPDEVCPPLGIRCGRPGGLVDVYWEVNWIWCQPRAPLGKTLVRPSGWVLPARSVARTCALWCPGGPL